MAGFSGLLYSSALPTVLHSNLFTNVRAQRKQDGEHWGSVRKQPNKALTSTLRWWTSGFMQLRQSRLTPAQNQARSPVTASQQTSAGLLVLLRTPHSRKTGLEVQVWHCSHFCFSCIPSGKYSLQLWSASQGFHIAVKWNM